MKSWVKVDGHIANLMARNGKSGRSEKVDDPEIKKWTGNFNRSGPFTFKLENSWAVHFYPLMHLDSQILVKWPSASTLDRPLWLKTVWDEPSTFARPFTLRTIHFHLFGPSTFDLAPKDKAIWSSLTNSFAPFLKLIWQNWDFKCDTCSRNFEILGISNYKFLQFEIF